MRSHVNMPFKDVHEYPGSGQTVVLLHGFLSSKAYWSKVSRLLSRRGHRVIAIDLVGFGDAPKPKDIRYSYDDHIRHIHEAISQLNVPKNFMLVGHSMGALLAMRYAYQYPDDVSHLALVNPPMYKDARQASSTLRSTGFVYRLLLDSRYRNILWILLRTVGPFSKHNRYSREGSLKNVINLAYFFEDLERTKLPTLLFIGKNDRAIYLDNLINRRTGKNVEVIIEETGHHAARTNPQTVADQIVRLTSRH